VKWESLRQNLPDTPVHDIAVEDRDLVIATHGRGFYVMDHIAPLRQGGLQTKFHLYKPDDALRGLDRNVAIDYYLTQPAQSVKMEFLGPDGKAIRTFTGTPADAERKPPVPDGATDDGPRRPPEPHPPVAVGLNRVTWDLRYPGSTDFPGLIMWAASSRRSAGGAGQLPGARDGRRPDRDAAVRGAARAAPAQGRDRSGSARRVRSGGQGARQGEPGQRRPCCWFAASRRRSRRGRPSSTPSPRRWQRRLDDFAAALSAIEGEIYQVKLQSSQDPLNFPIKLNNKIAALQGVIESADVRPTEQAYSVFRTLSNGLDEQLGKLDTT